MLEQSKAKKRVTHGNGQAVVSAIGRERAREKIRHLSERERDHDKIHTMRPQTYRAGHVGKCRSGGNRDRQRYGHLVDVACGKDGDRISADSNKGGMTKGDERAIADEQIETEGGDGENHDSHEQVEQIGLRSEGRS